MLFLRHNSVLVIQSCLTLHNTMDCSLAGSYVHGILQARIVEWIAISFSRGSRPRDQTWVSHIRGIFFTIWATREKEKTLMEKTLESPLDSKEIKPVNPKGNQPWVFIGMTDAEAPILWPLDAKSNSLEKTLMLGKRLRAKREGGQQRIDGWMASPSQWTWVWASSGRCWRTGKPGVLQSMESQRVGHVLVTEQQ